MQPYSRAMLVSRFASGVNGLLGAWIMVLPLLFGYAIHHGPDVWASLVIGGVLMTFGMLRLISPEELPSLSGINCLLGACILVSPWLLRFTFDPYRTWTDVAAGGLVIVLALLSAKSTLVGREILSRI
jgi:SPW repeat